MLDWCMIGMCGRNFFLQRAPVTINTHDCLPHTMEQIKTETHTRNPLRLTKHFETMWRLPTLFLLTKFPFFSPTLHCLLLVQDRYCVVLNLSPSLRLVKCVPSHQSVRSIQYGNASLQYCHRTEYPLRSNPDVSPVA